MSADEAKGTNSDSNAETTNAAETTDMSQDETPTTQQFTDPTADPEVTTTIPVGGTAALPTGSPFRVAPATPVPDDAVVEGSQLPHLPPPPAAPVDPAWPPPVLARPAPAKAPQPAPRPALVTVHKGPRPGAIMLGLLTMLVAAYVLVANLTDADLSFRLVGPPLIGAFGGMLLIVGLAGVVAGRLRR